MHWFKFYGGEYLSDPKMLALNASRRSCWITLLSYASMAEDGGRISHLNEYSLMVQAGVNPQSDEWEYCQGVLQTFEELGMITIDKSNGVISINNWNKRQETYLTNAERQKRFRDKQKSNTIVTPKSNNSNTRIEEKEKRIDHGAKAPIPLTIEEENPRQKKDVGYQAIFEVFSSTKQGWMIHKPQVLAAKRLLDKPGLEKVKAAMAFYKEHEGEQFFPEIHTPYDLEAKIGKLMAYKKKNGL